MNKQAVLIVGVLIAIAVVIYSAFLSREGGPSQREQTGQELVKAARRAAAPPKVSVPTSGNPVRYVLPAENPLEKTNPFNDVYVNPFE